MTRLPSQLERHFSYRAASEMIGVPEGTLRSWSQQGRIRYVKTGEGKTCRVLFPESALIEFLQRHTIQPQEDVVDAIVARIDAA